jgi:hypothetical protein
MGFLIIFAFISIVIFLLNSYRNKSNAFEIKNILSGKTTLVKIVEEVNLFHSKKKIPETTLFFTINNLEQLLLPLIGTNIKKEKYKLFFIKVLNDQNILLVIEASINDFVPGEISFSNFHYQRLELYKYIIRLDEKNREILLYSDDYVDLQMKLNKNEVGKYLMEIV